MSILDVEFLILASSLCRSFSGNHIDGTCGLLPDSDQGHILFCEILDSRSGRRCIRSLFDRYGQSVIDVSAFDEDGALTFSAGIGLNCNLDRGRSGSVSVSKDGGQVDALTGATITSRAVCTGVNAALNAVAKLG